MRLVESSEAASAAERAALGEMRRQLREWAEARRRLRSEPAGGAELTYARDEARAKVRAGRRCAAGGGAVRTRSRGSVHINLWTLDEPRRLRNGTLDAWLATSREENDNK